MTGDKPWPQLPIGNKDHTEAAVVIIGAGISGMCAAIDLISRNDCRNFVVLEKGSGLGGTWRDNKYPGCCCDVASILYSYSFEQNPDWSREYPGQEEILRYLVGVAQKYELYRYIRFGSIVEGAEWSDAEQKWHTQVEVQSDKDAEFGRYYTIRSDFLISAVGQLNIPQAPQIEGLADFRGKLMHSARWDWSYDLQGKKVGIIGNGATAAQIAPEVAPVAGKLTIHQRTPNWVIPRLDAPVPKWRQNIYRWLPGVMSRMRADAMDFRESFFDTVFEDTSASAQMWAAESKAHMRRQLPGRPDLWEKLQPQYKIGCKRVVITDDYFPLFLRDNVRLETGKIDRVTADGIIVDGKEEKYDLIVLATGFKSLEFMHPIRITGSAGRSLSSVWAEGGEALYGIAVESMPNFGMLYGPNTNLGHNSIILMIEAQSRYINGLIGEVLKARLSNAQLTLQPKPQRVAEYNRQLQSELAVSSFADARCGSWYKRQDNGKITQNWSHNVVDYQEVCEAGKRCSDLANEYKLLSKIDWTDFDISGSGAHLIQHGRGTTRLGRVVEETLISYQTLALTSLAAITVSAAVAIRLVGSFRLRA